MVEFIFLAIIIGLLIGFLLAYLHFKPRVELWAQEIGQRVFELKKAELEAFFESKYRVLLEQWKVEYEKFLREDALARSRAVLKGRLAEQLAPLFEVFGYNPHDARFIGDPVDYIIFDGYTKVKERMEDIPITIVLADVKTGNSELTYEQRRIREGIRRGLVRFEVIRL